MTRRKFINLFRKMMICCLCALTLSTGFVVSVSAKDGDAIAVTDSDSQCSQESNASIIYYTNGTTRNYYSYMMTLTLVAIFICLLVEAYLVFFYRSIRFKIDGISYDGKRGMNFNQWSQSKYNKNRSVVINRINRSVVVENELDESRIIGVNDQSVIENGREYHTR